MRQIAEFVFEDFGKLLPDDLAQAQNWGFAIREGEICPVVLDAGFSSEVKSSFY